MIGYLLESIVQALQPLVMIYLVSFVSVHFLMHCRRGALNRFDHSLTANCFAFFPQNSQPHPFAK
jgi:hypothetical protein